MNEAPGDSRLKRRSPGQRQLLRASWGMTPLRGLVGTSEEGRRLAAKLVCLWHGE